MWRHSASPSISGICQSVSTMWQCVASKMRNASSPVAATSTSYWAALRSADSRARTSASSSTTSIRHEPRASKRCGTSLRRESSRDCADSGRLNSLDKRFSNGEPAGTEDWIWIWTWTVTPRLSQRKLRLLRRHRPPEQVSLHSRTAQILEYLELLLGFNALGNDVDAEIRAHMADRPH